MKWLPLQRLLEECVMDRHTAAGLPSLLHNDLPYSLDTWKVRNRLINFLSVDFFTQKNINIIEYKNFFHVFFKKKKNVKIEIHVTNGRKEEGETTRLL